MQNPQCEVVGCPRVAAWVRVKNINSRHEDFLCHCCWQTMESRKPAEAACYVRSNTEDNFCLEHEETQNFDYGDEAVIMIR